MTTTLRQENEQLSHAVEHFTSTHETETSERAMLAGESADLRAANRILMDECEEMRVTMTSRPDQLSNVMRDAGDMRTVEMKAETLRIQEEIRRMKEATMAMQENTGRAGFTQPFVAPKTASLADMMDEDGDDGGLESTLMASLLPASVTLSPTPADIHMCVRVCVRVCQYGAVRLNEGNLKVV